MTGKPRFKGVLFILLLQAVLCAPIVRAEERYLIPLGELHKGSDNVLIGLVIAVSTGPQPGNQLMTIIVEEEFKGMAPATFTLQGSTIDGALPEFQQGQKVLCFLRATGPPSPGILEPVPGGQGVMEVSPGAEGVTRVIVQKVITLSDGIGLGDFKAELLDSAAPPPRLLVAALLDELTLRVDAQEGPLVAECACDSQGTYLGDAREWAMLTAGRLRVGQARRCLEAAVEARDPVTGVVAIEALGDLGDTESVPVLLDLLPPLPPDPTARHRGQDGEGDSAPDQGIGPDNDPEDETGPFPDPAEQIAVPPGTGGDGDPVGTPTPPPQEPDGEIVPDDAGEDKIRRRSDAGLALSAILALGKIGDRGVVPDLFKLAREEDDLALGSTVVHALGLIGGPTVHGPLRALSRTHPNALVRDQAQTTLERLASQRKQKGRAKR